MSGRGAMQALRAGRNMRIGGALVRRCATNKPAVASRYDLPSPQASPSPPGCASGRRGHLPCIPLHPSPHPPRLSQWPHVAALA
eukprot:gene6145-biopygen5204